MRRLSLWMRAHPAFGDSLIAGLLTTLDLGSARVVHTNLPAWLISGSLLLGPLVIRRRRPVLAAHLVLAGAFLQLVTQGYAPRGADFALAVMLYTMAADVGRRRAVGYAGWLTLGTVLWAGWRVPDMLTSVALAFVVALVFGFAWALGEFVGARRAYLRGVEERIKLLETERDQSSRIAVAEERTRIARELHDVVAHAVSVIVVQADGAGFTVRSNPVLTERVLNTISSTGREALAELRRLLGVLRSTDEDADRAPQPGTNGLSDLVDKIREVGLPVEMRLSGDLKDLPAGIGLGVYRIVQESLTNTLKHAGPGTSAVVTVTRADSEVRVEVSDNGQGTLSSLGTEPSLPGGNGLIGMRERASVFGGTLEAGPRPGGGWRVRLVLPLPIPG